MKINVREYRMDNPETRTTSGTQDEGTIQRLGQHRVHKTKTNKTQYVLDTAMRKQTQIM